MSSVNLVHTFSEIDERGRVCLDVFKTLVAAWNSILKEAIVYSFGFNETPLSICVLYDGFAQTPCSGPPSCRLVEIFVVHSTTVELGIFLDIPILKSFCNFHSGSMLVGQMDLIRKTKSQFLKRSKKPLAWHIKGVDLGGGGWEKANYIKRRWWRNKNKKVKERGRREGEKKDGRKGQATCSPQPAPRLSCLTSCYSLHPSSLGLKNTAHASLTHLYFPQHEMLFPQNLLLFALKHPDQWALPLTFKWQPPSPAALLSLFPAVVLTSNDHLLKCYITLLTYLYVLCVSPLPLP